MPGILTTMVNRFRLTTMVDILHARASVRTVLLRCLAVLATLCAVIHFAVAGTHFNEYWAFGVFMVVTAWLQLAWAIAVIARPSRAVLAAGAAPALSSYPMICRTNKGVLTLDADLENGLGRRR